MGGWGTCPHGHMHDHMIGVSPGGCCGGGGGGKWGGLNIVMVLLFVTLVFAFYYYSTTYKNEKEHAMRQKEANSAALARERRKYVIHGADKLVATENQSGSEKLSVDDVKRAVARIAANTRAKSSDGDSQHKSPVVGVRSDRDNNVYYVASDLPAQNMAADKFAEINRRAQTLLQSIDEQLDGAKRIVAEDGTDITDNMKQLLRKHYRKPAVFMEYHNPTDLTVGSNEEKGKKIEMCLRNKDDPTQWNPDNTLFRVHVHELAHSADFHFRDDGEEGHGPEFRRLHKYLLGVAENLGIYDCAEYKRSGKHFCGLVLNESYDCGDEKAKAGK